MAAPAATGNGSSNGLSNDVGHKSTASSPAAAPAKVDDSAKELDVNVPQATIALRGRGLTALPAGFVQTQAATLKNLDLSENKISSGASLNGLKLQTLQLDKNELAALTDFPVMPSLETLWINNNQLKDLKATMDAIEKSFPNVTYLSMMKNPCVPNLYFSDGEFEAYQRYRFYVIHRLKKLKLLDATQIDATEQKEADRVGKLSVVMKPQTTKEEDERPIQKATRPPIKPSKPPKVATFLGKGKPRYDGSNSEGNRFISNDEL